MSTSVDNRVVQMQFDNAQFESGVQQSLNTLTRLDAALSDLEKAGGFSGLSKGIDSIGNDLEETFSFRGVAALTTFQKIAEGVIDKVVGAFNSLKNNYMPVDFMDGIFSGGKRRAKNLEDAAFRLSGLGVEMKDIQSDIDYAVNETAYGMDEAAKAASQLVASGVEFGETFGDTGSSPMAKALRGISGVAAMTNSSYDEIANIFTTVSGNGKLMTKELRMMSYRGLNVAATMADQFNQVLAGSPDVMAKYSDAALANIYAMNDGMMVSEEFIRDHMKDGIISSELFFNAMDAAFGEHATKANETYAGSLANVGAALSRIGADYQGGIEKLNVQGHMKNMVEVFNSLKSGLNYLRTVLQPLTAEFLRFEQVFTHGMAVFFNGDNWADEVLSPFKNLVHMIDQVFGAIRTAFATVFPESTVENFTNVLTKINEFIASLIIPESTLTSITGIFTGIFSVIGVIVDAIKSAIYIISPFFNVLNYAAALVLAVFGKIGEALGFFRSELSKNDELKAFVELLHQIAEVISKAFIIALTLAILVVQNFEDALGVLASVVKLLIAVALAPLAVLFESIPKPIQNFIKSIGSGFKALLFYAVRFKDAVINAFTGEGGSLMAALGVVLDGVLNIPKTIQKAFAYTVAVAKNELPRLIPDELVKKLTLAKSYAQAFGATLMNGLRNIDVFHIVFGFEKLVEYFGRFKDSVITAFQNGGIEAAFATFKDGIKKLPNVVSLAFGDATRAITGRFSTLKTDIEGLFADAKANISSFGTDLFKALPSQLQNIITGVKTFGSTVGDSFTLLGERADRFVTNIKHLYTAGGLDVVFEYLKHSIKDIPDMLADTFKPVGTQAKVLFGSVKDNISSLFDDIKAKISTFGTNLFNTLPSQLQTIITNVKSFGATVGDSFTLLGERANRFITNIKNAFTTGGLEGVLTYLKTSIKNIPAALADTFAPVGTMIKDAFTTKLEAAKAGWQEFTTLIKENGIGAGFDFITEKFKSFGVSVQEAFNAVKTQTIPFIMDSITAAFSDLGQKFPIISKIGDAFSQLKGKIGTALSNVKTQLTSFAANMYQAGKDAISGLVKGFLDNSIVQSIFNAIKTIIGSKEGGGILGFLASLVGWHSPWAIMIAAGSAAILGLAIGMMDSAPVQMIKNAILYVVNTIKQLLQPLINFLKPFGQLIGKYLTFENINKAATVAGTAIAKVAGTIISFVTKVGSGAINKIISIKDAIVGFFTSISGENFSMAGVAEKLGGPFKIIYDGLVMIKGFVGKIFDTIGTTNLGKFGEVIQNALGITELVGIPATIIIFATFTTLIAHGFLKLVRGFGAITAAVKNVVLVVRGFVKAFQLNAELNAFRKIILSVAVLIGVISYALYTIGNLPTDKFNQSMQVLDRMFFFIGTMAVFFGALVVFTQLSSGGFIGSIKGNLQAATKSFVEISILMIGLAISVKFMIESLKDASTLADEVSKINLVSSLLILTGMLAMLGVTSILITRYAPSIAGGAITLLAIGFALKSIMKTFKELIGICAFFIDGGNVQVIDSAVDALLIMCVGLGILGFTFGKIGPKAGLSLLSMMLALRMLDEVFTIIINSNVLNTATLVEHIEQIGTVVLLIIGVFKLTAFAGPNALGAAATIAAIGVTARLLTDTLAILGSVFNNVSPNAIIATLGVLAVTFLGLASVLSVMHDINLKSVVGIFAAGMVISALLFITTILTTLMTTTAKLQPDAFKQAAIVMAILGVVVAAIIASTKLAENVNPKVILGLLGMMVTVLATILLFPRDPVGILAAGMALAGLVFVFEAISDVCLSASKLVAAGTGKKIFAALGTIILAIIAIAGSVLLLSRFGGDWTNIIASTGSLVLVLLAIESIVEVAGKVKVKRAVFQEIASLVTDLIVITLALTILSQCNPAIVLQDAIMLMAIMGIFVGITAYANKIKVKKAVFDEIFILAKSLALIALALTPLAMLGDWKAILSSALPLVAVMLTLAGVAKIIGTVKANEKATNEIITLVKGLIAVAAALTLLTAFGDWKAILSSALPLVAVMLALAGVVKIVGTVKANKTSMQAIKEIMILVAGIVAVAAALTLLTKFGNWKAILASTLPLVSVMLALAYVAKIAGTTKANKTSMKAVGEIIALAVSAGVLALMLTPLAKVGNWGSILASVVPLAGVMLALAYVAKIAGTVTVNPGAVLEIAGLAAAACLVAIALTPLSMFTNWSGILATAVALSAIMLALAGVAYIAGLITVKPGAIVEIVVLAAGMCAIALALVPLASLPIDRIAVAAVAVGALMAELAAVVAIMGAIGSLASTAVPGIVEVFALAIGICAIALALVPLTALPIENIKTAAIAVGALMAELAVVVAVMGLIGALAITAVPGLIEIFALAIGMCAIALALVPLASLPVENIKTAVIAVGGLMAELAIIVAVLSLIGGLAIAAVPGLASVIVLAIGMCAIALALVPLASLPVEQIQTAAIAVGALIALLGVLSVVLGATAAVSGGGAVILIALALGLVVFAGAVYIFSLAAQNFAAAVVTFSEAGFNLGAIGESILGVLGGLVGGISSHASNIATTLGAFITDTKGKIDEAKTKISEGLGKLFDFSGMTSPLESLKTVMDPVLEYLTGTGEGSLLGGILSLPGKIAEGLGNIGTSLASVPGQIKDAIMGTGDGGLASIPEEMTKAGTDAVAGLGQGLEEGQSFIASALETVIGHHDGGGSGFFGIFDALTGWGTPWDSTDAAGQDGDLGLAQGLLKGIGWVTNAAGNLATQTLGRISNTLIPGMSQIGAQVNSMMANMNIDLSGLSKAWEEGQVGGVVEYAKNTVKQKVDDGKQWLKDKYDEVKEMLNFDMPSGGGGGGGGGGGKSAKEAAEEAKRHEKAVRLQNEAVEEFVKTYGTCLDALEGTGDHTETAKAAIEDLARTFGLSEDEIADTESDIEELFMSMYDTISEAIDGSIDMFEKFSVDASIAPETMIRNMKSNLRGAKEFGQELQWLSLKGFSKELIEDLASEGPKAQAKVRTFLRMTFGQAMETNALYAQKTEAVSEATLKAITAIAYAGKTQEALIAVATDGTNSLESQAAKAALNAASKMTEVVATYRELRDGVEDVIESQMDLFSKFEKKTDMSAEEMLENMKSQLDGMKDWAGMMATLGARGVDEGLLLKLKDLGPKGYEMIHAFMMMTDEQLDQANSMYRESLTLPAAAAEQVAGSYLATGMKAAQSMLAGVTQEQDTVNQGVITSVQTAKQAADKEAETFEETGEIADDTLGQSLVDNEELAVDGAKTVADDSNTESGEVLTTGMTENGKNGVEGLAEGIEKNASIAIAQASALADAINAEYARIQKIQSPSKVWAQFGKYQVQGLANGLINNASMALNATDYVASETISTLGDALNMILDDEFGKEMSPTITPVLDLSEVRNGMDSMNSLLNGSTPYVRSISGGISGFQKEPQFDSNKLGAIIGERVNAAMSRHTEQVVSAIDMKPSGASNVSVVLEGDSNKIFKVVKTENDRMIKSTGFNPLAGAAGV